MFSGQIDVFHLTLGVISVGFVTWLSQDLLFLDRTAPARERWGQFGRLAKYAGWLLWQIVLSNLYVLRLAFGPKSNLQPRIVRHRTSLETDFEKFLLANSITLTPGTITIKIRGNDFFVHAITEEAAADVGKEMERRIAGIFHPEPGGAR